MKSRQAAALFLALLMLCAMLPRQRTLAETVATLHIAGVDYTTEQLGSDIVGTGWRWSAEKNEITLSGYNSGYITYYGTPKQDVSILVAAGTNNSITVPADLTEHGIHVGRNLTLSGAGNLSIAINRVYDFSNDEDYDGIYSNDGSISIDMAGKLDISVKDFCGIRACNHVTLSGTGDVNISAECGIWSLRGHVNSTMAGKLTIDARSVGIMTENISYAAGDIKLSGNGAVTINSDAYGIFAEQGNVSLSGNGTVSIILAANDDSTYGIYAYKDIVFSNNGAVTINANKLGICSEKMGVSLSGDGDVSITTGDGDSEGGYGIFADNDVNLSGSGDVNIDVEGRGIVSDFYSVSLSGDGDVSIRATNDGINATTGVTISGSGAVSITVHDSHTSTSGGIYSHIEDVIVSGSGKLTVSSDKDAVYLWDTGTKLKLNGTGTPLTFTSGEGYRAIYNCRDDASPVGGTEYHNYRETGAPNGTYVRYDHKSSVVEPVVLTAPSASKTYDGTALIKTTGVSATGLPEGYTVAATASGSQTDVGSSDNVVNEGYVIRDAGGNDKTADFPNVTKVNGTLTVTPATLTITADNKTREYDTTNPELTYSVSGLQGADSIASIGLDPAISTTAVQTSPVGDYPITFDGPTAFGNYNVSYVDGTLTVTPQTDPTTTESTTTESTETTLTTTDPTTTESTETSSTSADSTTTESQETTPTTTAPTTTESTETTPTSAETTPTTTTPTSAEPTETDEIRMIKEPPEWNKGSDISASFTSNADVSDFLYVRVDGKVVDRSNYDVAEGSTIVTFKAKFLETLSEGKHQVEIVSTTGIASGVIKIKGPAAEPSEETTQPSTADTVPKTGTNSGGYPWLALLLLSTGGLLFVLLRKRMLSQKK